MSGAGTNDRITRHETAIVELVVALEANYVAPTSTSAPVESTGAP